ncbi:hypothetical protein ES707_07209 [subsurface metagenome]
MADNGSCYKSFACRDLRIKHIRTKPYTPRTSGKTSASSSFGDGRTLMPYSTCESAAVGANATCMGGPIASFCSTLGDHGERMLVLISGRRKATCARSIGGNRAAAEAPVDAFAEKYRVECLANSRCVRRPR